MFSLRCRRRLAILQECSVCGSTDWLQPREVDVWMIVGEKYEYCPNCGTKVEHKPTRFLKILWARRFNRLIMEMHRNGVFLKR
ncbi:MAG TPA: hypothetical protein VJC12_00140 [Candidatus Paceibacterota bacterium]